MIISRPSRLRPVAAGLLVALALTASAPALAQKSLLTEDSTRPQRRCMTDYTLRNFLQQQGFSDVTLNAANGQRVPATGMKGGQRQLLTVDTCSRQISYRNGR